MPSSTNTSPIHFPAPPPCFTGSKSCSSSSIIRSRLGGRYDCGRSSERRGGSEPKVGCLSVSNNFLCSSSSRVDGAGASCVTLTRTSTGTGTTPARSPAPLNDEARDSCGAGTGGGCGGGTDGGGGGGGPDIPAVDNFSCMACIA